MHVTKKQILKTIFLPGILPRIGNLFGSGFSILAYLIALVYNTVRILPNNHPYLKPDMIGKYNSRQAIAEAANHIRFSKNNIDQIIIFFSIIASLIILTIQFILLAFTAIIPLAKANDGASMPTTIKGFFQTPNPSEDLAFRMLDLVFGIPDFFSSKEQTLTPLHQGLHGLFEFYSLGILIVGAMIIVYYVIAITAETAESGIPFGQRFNKAWTPIRVVLFFALLIPISNGLNGGQYVTLASAKLGSGLASTGWILFNKKVEDANETLLGKKTRNIAEVKPTDLSHIPAFMLIAKTCEYAYESNYHDKNGVWPASWDPAEDKKGVQAWAVYPDGENKYTSKIIQETKSFQNLTVESEGNDIHIVFGVKDKDYLTDRANVKPVCGSVVMKVTGVAEEGEAVIQTAYFNIIKDIWAGSGSDPVYKKLQDYSENIAKRILSNITDPDAETPPEEFKKEWVEYLKKHMSEIIEEAITAQIEKGKWQITNEMRDYGWGGAGIWYNKIAQQNGALVSAIHNSPVNVLYPRVMEKTQKRKSEEDQNPDPNERFKRVFSAETPTPIEERPEEGEIADALNYAYKYWEGSEKTSETTLTGNFFIDTINVILGTEGLFELCKNVDIHPLAQLSAVGKSMLDRAIGAFAAAGVFSVVSIIPNPFSGAAETFSSFFGLIGGIGLLVGFIMFYVIPFLPFIYFMFALGGWVKGIFEAMVAIPLWTLAHLRIDGDGIPGEAAIGGYFLIFEIFIRPILIVFGLLAAITVFAAMVRVLNEVFYLVVSNLSGHDPKSTSVCFRDPALGTENSAELKDAFRGPVDEFFFTILYAIIVYLIGVASFKLIDAIPNSLLSRWAGVDVPTFNDDSGDAAEGLLKYVSIGGSRFGSSLGSSVGDLSKGVKGSVQSFLK